MPDRTGIFLGWSANLSNFLGLGVEAGASPMYPQKMRVPPPPPPLVGGVYDRQETSSQKCVLLLLKHNLYDRFQGK